MRWIALLLLAVPVFGQDDPTFLVAAGASYNAVGSPKIMGWSSVAIATIPGLYSITTIDEGVNTTSLRTGLAKKIRSVGGFTFLLHADAGLTTSTVNGSANALGSYSAGPMVTWKLPFVKGLYAVSVVRFTAITSVSVRPVYEFGFGWGL